MDPFLVSAHGRPAPVARAGMRVRARLGGASLCAVLACAGGGAAAAAGKVLESQQRYAPTAAQLALVEHYRGAPLEDFSEAVFDAGKTDMPYRLLAPARPVAGERYPLVVFFHSSGGIGDDNLKPMTAFTRLWAAPDVRRSFPAYVVVPQMRDRSANYINDTHGLRVSQPGAPLADVLALVDELMRRHPIDPARVYALGFSMGASAAMDAAVARPGLFAAMVALSGVPPERSLARSVAHVPTLLIHGDYDQENAYVGAQVWAEELAAAGGRPRFITYVGMDHRVPPQLFTDGAWRQWLFEQRKPR